jgi:hypothetical protein
VSDRAEGVRVAYPLFQAEGGGSTPTSALQLWVHRVMYDRARELNALWHSRLPRIGDPTNVMKWVPCFAATHGDRIYAVAIWSHPVSPSLPQTEWLELRRMAVAPDAPRNTPSRFLAVMTRLLRKQEPHLTRLISYQDTDVHTGAIYRAAGWSATRRSEGDTWDRPSRPRADSQTVAPKHRWEKELGAPA